jgi:ATP-dependent RNA helicase RhlE
MALCAGKSHVHTSNEFGFSNLGLADPVLRALRKEEYTTPTPIQTQAIPILMQGHDLLGIAQTGTGKTAAFATPLLSKMVEKARVPAPRSVRVLVLAPTRELAAQIHESFKAYGRFITMRSACVVGGVGFGAQVQALHRGLDVLVATPGRLLDHLEQGNVRLDQVEAVVLDEADHMLDLGFLVPIRKIMAKLPRERQSLFFSATMPKEIARLSGEFLSHPKRVEVTPVAATAERVRQEVIHCAAANKGSVLAALLSQPEFERTIVFTRTKRGADKVCKLLEKSNIQAIAIHGNKSQGQRQAALAAFKSGDVRVLIATDIAARGIDVTGVSHVINFELPDVAESYVHRIGRTARAGAEGVAIALVGPGEQDQLRAIEKLTRQAVPVSQRSGLEAFAASADSRELADMLARDEAMRAGRVVRGGRNGGGNRAGGGKTHSGQNGSGKPATAPRNAGGPRPQPAHGKRQGGAAAASAKPSGSRPAQARPVHAGAQRPASGNHAQPAGETQAKRRSRPGSRSRARARSGMAAAE